MSQHEWTPVDRGATTEVFRIDCGKVVNLYDRGTAEEAVRREFAASLFAFEQGILTPEPLKIIETEERYGAVFREVRGCAMLSAIAADPSMTVPHISELARLHRDLHRRPGNVMGRHQREVLSTRLEHISWLSLSDAAEIRERLRGLPDGSRLCHGDFHPGNILLAGERAWIIDWMDATSGHPVGDVARTALLLRYGSLPGGTPEEVRLCLSQIRRQMMQIYLHRYAAGRVGLIPEVRRWMVPVAAVRLTRSSRA